MSNTIRPDNRTPPLLAQPSRELRAPQFEALENRRGSQDSTTRSRFSLLNWIYNKFGKDSPTNAPQSSKARGDVKDYKPLDKRKVRVEKSDGSRFQKLRTTLKNFFRSLFCLPNIFFRETPTTEPTELTESTKSIELVELPASSHGERKVAKSVPAKSVPAAFDATTDDSSLTQTRVEQGRQVFETIQNRYHDEMQQHRPSHFSRRFSDKAEHILTQLEGRDQELLSIQARNALRSYLSIILASLGSGYEEHEFLLKTLSEDLAEDLDP